MPRNISDIPPLDNDEFLQLAKRAKWRGNLETVDEPLSWRCFYCHRSTAPKSSGQRLLAKLDPTTSEQHIGWLVKCTYCNLPTLLKHDNTPFLEGSDIPPVPSVPEDVSAVFDEANTALTIGCYSAAVLLSRKLIMHLAFDIDPAYVNEYASLHKGRTPGFTEYVSWLADNHHMPPQARPWVDRLVKRGNEENHQLVMASKAEAEQMVRITRMLLSFNYEFGAVARQLNQDDESSDAAP